MPDKPDKSQRIIRVFLVLLVFLATVFRPEFPEWLDKTGLQGLSKKFNSALLEAMKGGKKLGYEGRYRLLDPVIRNSFSLSSMARSAAGNYWDSFSEEERKVYLKTYSEWSVANYAGRFTDYSGEQFRLISESPPERNTVTVLSKLIESNGNDLEFKYHLRLVEGSWRIVDIRILGVSQLWLTKAQFVFILGVKGFDGLISMLNDKTRKLSQGDGE